MIKRYDIYDEIIDLSLDGQLHIYAAAQRYCYNSSGGLISKTTSSPIPFATPYVLSVRNSFFNLGCPSQGYITNGDNYFAGGCVSVCGTPETSLGGNGGSCSGAGCCQSAIARGLSYYESYWNYFQFDLQNPGGMIPTIPTNCSYVFVADPNRFHFNSSYLSKTDDFTVQMSIDWAIRNAGNCSYAKQNMSDFACRSANHDCHDSDNGVGYTCNCSEGFQGNAYITEGCQGVVVFPLNILNYIIYWKLNGPSAVKLVEYKAINT
jgi:hypothetical protein